MAVKVIDHRVKGNGNAVDIQRETILSTSVVHPNVVCYRGISNLSVEGCHPWLVCSKVVIAATIFCNMCLTACKLKATQGKTSRNAQW